MEFLQKHSLKIACAILLFFFALNLVVSDQEATTMDERAHIPSAYSYVRYGDMRLNPEHPPLLKDLAGLPLLALQPEFPIESEEWKNGINAQWILGQKFISCLVPEEACNDADQITFWSRVPIVLVAVLMGIFLFVWTRSLAGKGAALFALTLYAFDPNIIAHSHFVTTDIGIAAFLFFSFYYFVRFLQDPSRRNIIISGIWLALANLAKFSAVLLFPIFGLFVILYALSIAKPKDVTLSTFLFKLKQIWIYGYKFALSVALCFVIIWVYYYPHTMNMPGIKLVEVAGVMFPDKQMGPFAKSFIAATYDNSFLKPYSAYFLGVFMVFGRVAGGNTYYFLGQVSNQASPWYFPVVFILKSTLPFLFLLVATTFYSLYRIVKSFKDEQVTSLAKLGSFLGQSLQRKTAQYVGVFFVLFYSLVSITGNLNIGFRHLFPILPFLFMFIAKVVFDIIKRQTNPVTQKVSYGVLGVFTFIIVATPFLSYPHFVSYFNGAFGGHTNGYVYVTDSNYDWGQDLKRLKTFVDTHNRCASAQATSKDNCAIAAGLPPIDKLRIDYFGGATPEYYFGDTMISWHAYTPREPGWYAVSIGFMQENVSVYPGYKGDSYDWLVDHFEPVTRTGDSIFVYYVPEVPVD
jgi:predicted membrane-bound dolichyl-phosphate-mannose-protein mannosyltransferase